MKRYNEKGISLIELLAAIAISALMIGGITALIFQTNQGFQTITTRESVQEKGRMITEHIVNRVRSESYSIQIQNNVLILDSSTPSADILYRFTRPDFTIETGNSTMTISNQVDEATFTYDSINRRLTLHLLFIGNNKPYDTSIQIPNWGS